MNVSFVQRYSNQPICTLSISLNDSIQTVKESIWKKIDRHYSDLTLFNNDIELIDCKCLKDYNISSNAIIEVRAEPFKVTIQGLTVKATEILIDPSLDVEICKEKISFVLDIPVEAIRLIWAGRCVYEGRSLIDFNVPNGSVIHMILRLRGGG